MDSYSPEKKNEEQEGSSQKNYARSPSITWSIEFNCRVVNGILAPVPISRVPLETESDDEQPASSLQAESSSGRKRTKEGNNEELFFFRLFKFPKAGEKYIMEMHEVKTGGIDRRQLLVLESNNKWKVGVYDLPQSNHIVFPVLEDPAPLMFHKKYQLSLQERLVGWTLEKRKRGNGKEDTFYYHRGRQFRSFVDVTAFILYSNKLKDLKLISTSQTSHNLLEAEATQVMMTMSSSGIIGNNPRNSTDGSTYNVTESTPQKSNEKPNESSFSSVEPNDDHPLSNTGKALQENENSSLGLEEAGKEKQNELVCADPREAEKTEMEQMEDVEFMDYVHNIFKDEALPSLNEIFGELILDI